MSMKGKANPMRALIWSAGALALALSPFSGPAMAQTSAGPEIPNSSKISAADVQALLEDGWRQVQNLVLVKDLNGNQQIEVPEEVRLVVAEPAEQGQ